MKYLFAKLLRSKSLLIITILVFCLLFFLIFSGMWNRLDHMDLDHDQKIKKMMHYSTNEIVLTIFIFALSSGFIAAVLLSNEIDSGFILIIISKIGGRKRYYKLRWIVGILAMQIFIFYMVIVRYMGTLIWIDDEIIKNKLIIMNLYYWSLYEIIGFFFISLAMFLGGNFKSRVTISLTLMLAFVVPILSITKWNLYKRKYSFSGIDKGESIDSNSVSVEKDKIISINDFSINDFYNESATIFNWSREVRGDDFYDYISSWKYINPELYIESLFTSIFSGIANEVEKNIRIKWDNGEVGIISYYQETIGVEKSIESLKNYEFLNMENKKGIRSVLLKIGFQDIDIQKQMQNDLKYFEDPQNRYKNYYKISDIYEYSKLTMLPIIEKYKDDIWKIFINSQREVKFKWIKCIANVYHLWQNVKLPGFSYFFENENNWENEIALGKAEIDISHDEKNPDIRKLKNIIMDWTLALFSSLHPTKETINYVNKVNSKYSSLLVFWSANALRSLGNNDLTKNWPVPQEWDDIKQEYYWDYTENQTIQQELGYIDENKDNKIFIDELLKIFIKKGIVKIKLVPFINYWTAVIVILFIGLLFNIMYYISYKKRNIM